MTEEMKTETIKKKVTLITFYEPNGNKTVETPFINNGEPKDILLKFPKGFEWRIAGRSISLKDKVGLASEDVIVSNVSKKRIMKGHIERGGITLYRKQDSINMDEPCHLRFDSKNADEAKDMTNILKPIFESEGYDTHFACKDYEENILINDEQCRAEVLVKINEAIRKKEELEAEIKRLGEIFA